MPNEITNAVVEEYQRRRREFQPLWNRNFLLVALPGFLLFLLGNPMMLDIPNLIFIGFPLFGYGMLRGLLIAKRHLRCPVCDRFQSPGKSLPNRVCLGCGAALSYGMEDS
jgi:hypothetical protein